MALFVLHLLPLNPATRQSRVIPTLDFSKSKALGSGYDPIGEDFKLVSVGHPSRLSATMYSANRDVWRQVPDQVPIHFPSGEFSMCVNGFLFGIGENGMMVFDLNKEVMNCVKLPFVSFNVDDDNDAVGGDYDHDEIYEARDQDCIIEFNKTIAVIILWANALDGDGDNKLKVVRNRKDWRSNKKINMWMLNDSCLRGGGDGASWTLMFSIDLAIPAERISGYFNNGHFLLLTKNDDYMWILCNADKKEAIIVPLSVEMAGYPYSRDVYKYRESLFSLAGFKQTNWNAEEDEN